MFATLIQVPLHWRMAASGLCRGNDLGIVVISLSTGGSSINLWWLHAKISRIDPWSIHILGLDEIFVEAVKGKKEKVNFGMCAVSIFHSSPLTDLRVAVNI
mgnify:FL=1